MNNLLNSQWQNYDFFHANRRSTRYNIPFYNFSFCYTDNKTFSHSPLRGLSYCTDLKYSYNKKNVQFLYKEVSAATLLIVFVLLHLNLVKAEKKTKIIQQWSLYVHCKHPIWRFFKYRLNYLHQLHNGKVRYRNALTHPPIKQFQKKEQKIFSKYIH